MLEKFTEKAILVVTEAQNQARLMQNVSVQPEHFLLALAKLAKGISLKIFRDYNITFLDLQKVVEEKLRFESMPLSPFYAVNFSSISESYESTPVSDYQ